jgi:hypothetical protein
VGLEACQFGGAANGTFSASAGSCHGFEACDGAGQFGDFSVGDGTCIGDDACEDAGEDGGSFSAGAGSCVGESACLRAGDNGTFSIGNFSCNTDGNFAVECQAMTNVIGDCMFNDTPGPVECMPDVSVGLTCLPGVVAPGADVTCTIEVRNQTFVDVQDATMSTATPANTTFVSLAVPPDWTCATPSPGGTGSIDCDPDLAPNSVHTFSLVLNVNAGAPDGTLIAVAAAVDATDDSNPDNNAASAFVAVEEPDDAEDPDAQPTPILCCPVDLDADIDNTNTNVIGIENENDNDNENTNVNNNENTNVNTNIQDQDNDQSQDNANQQTNNITSSPSVNIDFGR